MAPSFFLLLTLAAILSFDMVPLDIEPFDIEPLDIWPFDMAPLFCAWAKAAPAKDAPRNKASVVIFTGRFISILLVGAALPGGHGISGAKIRAMHVEGCKTDIVSAFHLSTCFPFRSRKVIRALSNSVTRDEC